MKIFRAWLATGALLALTLASAGYAPVPPPKKKATPPLPVGLWRVEFENGVVESCEVRKDGSATVVEPLRSSRGKATVNARGVVVIVCEDDRTERWSPDGKRMKVEHWFPSSQYPAGKAVNGIARRGP
jgi:hypothetical protein